MTAFTLPAVLTHDQARGYAHSLGMDIRAEQGDKVVINAAALEKFDSSALAVLLQCRRDSAASGKSFEVTGLPQQLRQLANLYGINELLDER